MRRPSGDAFTPSALATAARVYRLDPGTDRITEFDTRVVRHADLDGLMPADPARVTPEERAEQMRLRFHSILRRYLF